MPKYKVGDVAALFSKPKEPTTEAGKKLQSLFKEFYNKKNRPHTELHQNTETKQNAVEKEITEPENQRLFKKNKKRKFSDCDNSDSFAEKSNIKKFKLKQEPEDAKNLFQSEKKNRFLAGQDFPRNKKSSKVNGNKFSKGFNDFEAEKTAHSNSNQESNDIFKSKGKKQASSFIKKSKQTKQNSSNKFIKSKVSEKFSNEEEFNNDTLFKTEIEDFIKKSAKELKIKNFSDIGVMQQSSNTYLNNGVESVDNKKCGEVPSEKSFKKAKISIKNGEDFARNKKLKKRKNNNDKFGQKVELEVPERKEHSFIKFPRTKSESKEGNKNENEDDEKCDEVPSEESLKNTKTIIKNSEDFIRNTKFKKRKTNDDSFVKKSELKVSEKGEPDFIKLPSEKYEDEADKLSRTLFVGNLPTDTNKRAIKALFSPFGEIEDVRYHGIETDKAKIFGENGSKFRLNAKNYAAESVPAFVVFKKRESAIYALSLSGSLFKDHHITVDFALPAGTPKLYDGKRSIFIGNLPFGCKDESVWEAFSECGRIENVRIVRDKKTGIGKGFGYVQFSTVQSKENALELKDLKVQGRLIRIKPLETDKKTQNKSNNVPPVNRNTFKSQAIRLKKKNKDSSSRKSVTKIMKKQKKMHEKKKISSILQKSMKK